MNSTHEEEKWILICCENMKEKLRKHRRMRMETDHSRSFITSSSWTMNGDLNKFSIDERNPFIHCIKGRDNDNLKRCHREVVNRDCESTQNNGEEYTHCHRSTTMKSLSEAERDETSRESVKRRCVNTEYKQNQKNEEKCRMKKENHMKGKSPKFSQEIELAPEREYEDERIREKINLHQNLENSRKNIGENTKIETFYTMNEGKTHTSEIFFTKEDEKNLELKILKDQGSALRMHIIFCKKCETRTEKK